MRFMKLSIGILLLAALVYVVVTALQSPAPDVEVASARLGPLAVHVSEEGRTRVRDRFVISAPITGRLIRTSVRPGDTVKRGATVMRMLPSPVDRRTLAQDRAKLDSVLAEKQAADARVGQALAALDQARRAHKRVDELSEQGIKAAQDREQIELDEAMREKELEAARYAAQAVAFEVEAVRASLLAAESATGDASASVTVVSPIGGTVLRVLEESERVVAAGTPLIEVGDPSRLEIVVDILSTDATRVRPGSPMRATPAAGLRELEARVRTVEPSAFTKVSPLGIEEQRVNVIGDFLKAPEGIGDGYRVDVDIEVWKSDRVLKVPGSALFRVGSDWALFVVQQDVAIRKIVKTGHHGTSEVEVVEGLQEGDVVIVHPGDQVHDGGAVNVRTRLPD